MSNAKSGKNAGFESAMKRLSEISAQMNDAELPLEIAVKLYSEASELIKICRSELSGAQLEFKTLLSEAGV